jgi:NADH:ubiquinone oxidoreductase subunit
MQNDEFADLLWGAQIADYIGRNYRQTVYSKKLPAQKIGAMWIGHRGKLRARLLGDAASNGGAE